MSDFEKIGEIRDNKIMISNRAAFEKIVDSPPSYQYWIKGTQPIFE